MTSENIVVIGGGMAGLTAAAYQARKAAEAQRLIGLAEEFIPGLSSAIEVCDIATPLTYERYTGNYQGSTVGWNWDPARNPHIDYRKDLPQIQNFSAAGHWYFRLGGLVSAMVTARYQALELC